MRFIRRPRCEYSVTDRKRAAARRFQQRQRDSLPLLAPLVAESQPSIDDLMTARIAAWIVLEQRYRDHRAELWRRGRHALDQHDPATRRALLDYWNGHRWLPGDPVYLLDMLHMFDTGRLAIADGQVRAARVVIPVSEAADTIGKAKPVSGGWLGKRARPSPGPAAQRDAG